MTYTLTLYDVTVTTAGVIQRVTSTVLIAVTTAAVAVEEASTSSSVNR